MKKLLNKVSEDVLAAIVITVFIAFAVIVSNMDFQDERMTEKLYCSNVADKVWGDYDKSIDCGEVK